VFVIRVDAFSSVICMSTTLLVLFPPFLPYYHYQALYYYYCYYSATTSLTAGRCVADAEECERTLRVSGLPEEADDDDIYAVFESERIGGGPVEQIYRLDASSALVIFHDRAGTH